MPFVIPKPIQMFPGGAQWPVLPSLVYSEPLEGKRYIPIEIAWDGNGTTYQMNAQGLTTQPFSQIVMFDVDNSQSGAPVTFYFPDSADTLVVPAESGGLFPVFTGGVQFYAAAPAALVSDVTRLRLLNYRQEPVALPPPEFSQIATALNLAADGTTALLGPTISGTLTGYSVNLGLALAGGGPPGETWLGTLKDHATGAVIDQASVVLPAASQYNGIVLSASGIAVRFSGGLDFTILNSNVPSVSAMSCNVAIRYRTP